VTLQLIAGRAGSGKTEHCLAAVANELGRSMTDGPALLVLTPEQATLQTERQILARTRMQALGRCDVLGFTRLAYRIFADTPGNIPTTLTATGRQMAIRYLLAQHRMDFREFNRIADSGSLVREASAALAEFFREAVSFDKLNQCVQQAIDEQDPSAGRLHDLALLYRKYCEYLGAERVDPDGVLALAKDRLATTEWLRDARVWVDGFASFTRQQAQLLIELARHASHTTVALLVDPAFDNESTALDETDLFYKTRRAWSELVRSAVEAGITIESPVKLTPAPLPRFAASPRLALLEANALTPTTNATSLQPNDSDNAEIHLVEGTDLRSEVQAAARNILDLTRRDENSLRLRDIAIIVRDLEPYHDILSAEFARHGIPFFLDRRRPIHHHPLIEAVRALLALVGGGGLEDAILRLVKTDLTPLDHDASAALENYLLARNLTDPNLWNQTWTGKPPAFRSAHAQAAQTQMTLIDNARTTIRTALGDWWPASLGEIDGRTWATQLVQVLDRLGAAATLATWSQAAQNAGQHDTANEHERVWTELMQLLEEFVDALGDVPLRARRVRETLEAGLAELALGLVPATLDQVVISTIERGRQPLGIKATFILGFADGLWSGRPPSEGLLGDDERDRLEAADAPLGRSRRDRLAEERILTYVALTRATQYLWISRPTLDEKGRQQEAALHWPDIERVLGETVEVEKISGDESIGTANDLAATIAEGAGQAARGTPVVPRDDAPSWLSYYHWAQQTVASLHDKTGKGPGAPALLGLGDQTNFGGARVAPGAPALPGLGDITTPATPRSNLHHQLTRALDSIQAIETHPKLAPQLVEQLWPTPHHSSITRLEQFARCPFQHFARYGLTLLPRETRELSQLHWGNFYHKALEQFANDLLESGARLDEVDDQALAQRAETICTEVLPGFLEQQQLDDMQGHLLRRRGVPYLARFLRWQKHLLGAANFAPQDAELDFGNNTTAKWPALSIQTPEGRTIHIDGKIDRLDLATITNERWAVVFDYKTNATNKRLKLDEVYHGMALQLLAYLLAVKDALSADGGDIRLGGAFLSTIMTDPEKVDHPSAADAEDFNAFNAFQPRGIVDFDAIPTLDKHANGKSSSIFQAEQKRDGNISRFDTSDAVEPGMLDDILQFVRGKLGQLADCWLDGDIAVAPLRLGRKLPCDYCDYQSVCRFEYRPEQMRFENSMKRSEAIRKMQATNDEQPEADA